MNDLELREFRDFLSAAIAQWGKSGAVHPLCADPDLFVFKTVADPLLARDRIEEAIEQFIATDQWPQFSSEDTIYILHRAWLAVTLVDSYIENPAAWALVRSILLSGGKAAFLRWFLITAWNEGGANYMKAWAEKYLERNPPPPR